MFNEMRGKVAMITGATSGIGRHAALLFAHHGVKIAAVGRNAKEGDALVRELGNDALFIQADLKEFREVKNAVHQAYSHFRGLHFAINNAGTEGNFQPLCDEEEEDFDLLMSINLKAVWAGMKFQIPLIAKSGGGAIVNISTNITRTIVPGTSLYTASKMGVEGLTQVAALEHGPSGVRINAIAPGAVDTPMIRRLCSKEELKRLIDTNPLKKMAHPDDIASMALYLCSAAAGHINGASIVIDGGSSL